MSQLTYNDIDRAAEALAPIFAANGWEWRDAVPTEADIAAKISHLVELARWEQHGNKIGHNRVSTGRITVLRHNTDADNIGSYHEEIRLEMGVITSSNQHNGGRITV